MRIGDMARETGVPINIPRCYERRGLVAPTCRSPWGYREFHWYVRDRETRRDKNP